MVARSWQMQSVRINGRLTLNEEEQRLVVFGRTVPALGHMSAHYSLALTRCQMRQGLTPGSGTGRVEK